MSKRKYIGDWLSIDENVSTANNFMNSEVADTVLIRTADDASSSSEDKDGQPAIKKVSLEKCISFIGEILYALEEQDYISKIHWSFVLNIKKKEMLKKS